MQRLGIIEVYPENTELMVKAKVIQEEWKARKLLKRAKGALMKNHDLMGK